MPVKKLAISLPQDVLAQVDKAAARRHITRSRFISDVLRRAATAQTDPEITHRLDELFRDRDLDRAQRETARAFRRAATGRGTEW